MPLRDDHQAAIARADALQRQLDEERARGADGADEVKRLATELAETRSRLRRAEAELSDLRAMPPVVPPSAKPRPAWMDELEDERRPMVMNAAGGLVATGALIFLLLIISSC